MRINRTQFTRGLSLTELVVAAGIGSLLLAAVLMFWGRGFSVNRAQFEQTLTTEDARVQLERMSDALRNARSDGANPWMISNCSLVDCKYELAIYSNVDDDGENEQLRYVLNGSVLDRGVTQPAGSEELGTVARSLRNIDSGAPLFTYFDVTGTEIPSTSATATNVHQIEIHLIIDTQTGQDPEAVDIVTRVTPREVEVASGTTPARLWPVTIDMPNGEPPASNQATVTVNDPNTGTQVSQDVVSVEDLNDGRIATFGENAYAHMNYQTGIVGSFLPDWYTWIGPFLLGYQGGSEVTGLDQISFTDLYASNCLGADLASLLTTCASRNISSGTLSSAYRSIFTYAHPSGDLDYIRDVTFGGSLPPPPPGEADLALTYFGSTDSVEQGTDAEFDLVVTNLGPDVATGIQVTATLPAGTSFSSAVGDFSCVESGGVLTCDATRILHPGGVPLELVVYLDTSGATCDADIFITFTVSANEADPDLSNNSVTVIRNITCTGGSGADLSIIKTGPLSVAVDTASAEQYSITATNNGPGNANGAEIRDTVPPGVTFGTCECILGIDIFSCTFDGSDLVCATSNPFSVGAVFTMVWDADMTGASCPSTITNTVTISSSTADPNLSNNSASWNTDGQCMDPGPDPSDEPTPDPSMEPIPT